MQKMLQLRLNDSFHVPVFELEGYKETYCLLDTGATMAVWCSGTGYLQEVFQNAVPTGSQRDMFLSVTRMRKFTHREADILRDKFHIDVPAGMEIIDGINCLPQEDEMTKERRG